ncbi:MAG: hypothetical protein AAGU05_12500, partial [Anaerolineaceae bacterium]
MNRAKINKFINRLPIHVIIIVILIIWIVPTLGLLITSFRPLNDINTSGWWTVFTRPVIQDNGATLAAPRFTLNNYIDALVGYRGRRTYLADCAEGRQSPDLRCNISDLLNPRGMGRSFLNSLMVTLPATVLPILFATFAGYAFAWLDFKGRILLFAVLVGLQVVPLQMTLVPISRMYARLGLNGTLTAVWLFHTGFGMPYAIYLMRNYLGAL